MKKIIVGIIVISALFLGVETTFAGFGITPPYVKSDTLTRGSQYEQEIILVRGDPIEDLKVEITINVPGINGWISVDRGNEFILPKGESQVPIIVSVRVPEDADYDEYTGSIRIRTSSLEQRSGVSIALGAQVDVAIKVVDNIYDFEVRRVELREAEEGYKKWWLDYPGRVTFLMHIENTGNAPVAPSKVVFDIYDRKGEVLLETVQNIGEIQIITAFDTSKVAAYLPTHLKPGGYKVKYSIYKEDTLSRSGDLNLSILPRGIIPGYEPFGFEGLSFTDKASIIGPIIGFVLLLLGVITWLFLSRGSKGKSKSRVYRSRKNNLFSKTTKQKNDHQSNLHTSRRINTSVQRRPSQGNVIDLSKRK
ncbi:MAG: hypothetical protein KAS07_03390 [Candidatus Pacebacteria bacterium]|nr:hypothetical protein [Candidatus Paceibacterota bacterium]